MTRGPAIALLTLAATARVAAQSIDPSWYLLNVGVYSAASGGQGATGFDLQRWRVMLAPHIGPLTVDFAYEQFLVLQTGTAPAIAGTLGQPVAQDWLPLQGTLASGEHLDWRDRVDRLSLRYSTPSLEITAGRQTISWATTLLLTPADPFAPLDPSDPFREYRAGIDALSVRVFPGPFSEIGAAARVADTPDGRRLTGGVRGKIDRGAFELSGWAGAVAGDAAGSLGLTWTVAGAAVRSEVELRASGDSTVVRGTVGIDRNFTVAGRALYLAAEYQHDGFGATSAGMLAAVAASAPAQRGELQVAGRDETAWRATWQADPLVSVELLALVNLDDGSALMTPAVSYAASSRLTLRGGLFAGLGKATPPAVAPASEYGGLPISIYLSASLFY